MSDTYEMLDITLRSTKEVAARVLVLAALCRRAFLERHDPFDDLEEEIDDRLADELELEDAESERFDLVAWLADERLLEAATAGELALLHAPIGALRGVDADRATWAGEALVSLLWSAGMIDLPPSYDGPADLEDAWQVVPAAGDSTQEFARSLRLRDEDTIAAERDRTEVWFWRIAVEGMRRDAGPSDLAEIDEAITETTEEAFGLGIDVAIGPTDFLVDGRPVREIDDDVLADVAVAAEMRLRAMNWLCGFGTGWDDVPLEV